MPRATIAFGPGESYFFDSPHKWSHQNLPDNIRDLISEKDLKEIKDISLGPGGAYTCSYIHNDDTVWLKHWNLPKTLSEWLITPEGNFARDDKTLRVRFGPNNEFVAWDAKGSRWEGIPTSLGDSLGSNMENGDWIAGRGIKQISLGAEGTYVYFTNDGRAYWELEGKNDAVDKWLANGDGYENIEVGFIPFFLSCQHGTCSESESSGSKLTFPLVHKSISLPN